MKKSLLIALLSAGGCASVPPPTDHLASAIAATRAAEEGGALAVPRAALQLKLAKEGVATARHLIESGENERADFMTLRAYNDAELALALAHREEAVDRSEQAVAEAAASEAAASEAAASEAAAPKVAAP